MTYFPAKAIQLKCTYKTGLFPTESVVSFEHWSESSVETYSCFVQNAFLEKINGLEGLVLVDLLDIDNKFALVNVMDEGEKKQTTHKVSKSNLVLLNK